MAHYKRITRKKETKQDLLLDPSERIQEWIGDNVQIISLALALAILLVIIVYGVAYYKDVTFSDAQGRLYEASSSAPREGATASEAFLAVSAIEDVIAAGGPDEVILQARLDLAALSMRAKDYTKAIEHYAQAIAASDKGSLYQEVALAGEAAALGSLGKFEEAESKLKILADSAQHYPKTEILVNLAYTQAANGKTKEAVDTLDQLQTEFPAFMPITTLQGVKRRINNGELKDAALYIKVVRAEEAIEAAKAAKARGELPVSGAIEKGAVHETKQ